MHAFIRLVRMAQALVIATTVASEAYAQSTTGTIQGSVRDEQCAVIPGATVTIRNIDTNLVRSVVSGTDGDVPIPQPSGRQLHADRGAGRVRPVHPGRHPAAAEPGCGGGGDAPPGGRRRDRDRAGRHAAAQHDQRRGRGALRQPPHLGAAAGQQPRHLQPGALGRRRQPAGVWADRVLERRQLRGERRAPALQQHHAGRPGQQRPERDRPPAADQQHRHRAGSAAHHEPVLGRVRPGGRLGDERHHQERHQPVPRVGVLVPQRQQPQRADESRQERQLARRRRRSTRTRSGSRWAGPIFKDRTFFFGSYQNWRQKIPRHRGSRSTARRPRRAGRSAVGRRQPSAGRGAAEVPACRAGADRQERDVHRQRADLHRAAGLAHRVVHRRVRQRPGLVRIDQQCGLEQPASAAATCTTTG